MFLIVGPCQVDLILPLQSTGQGAVATLRVNYGDLPTWHCFNGREMTGNSEFVHVM